jgi:hypothetical protein
MLAGLILDLNFVFGYHDIAHLGIYFSSFEHISRMNQILYCIPGDPQIEGEARQLRFRLPPEGMCRKPLGKR